MFFAMQKLTGNVSCRNYSLFMSLTFLRYCCSSAIPVDTLPHPSCKYDDIKNGLVSLKCMKHGAAFFLLNSYTMAAIHPNTSYILIFGFVYSLAEFPTIPERSHLNTLTLSGSKEDMPYLDVFPFSLFLVNNKRHVGTLYLTHLKLKRLTRVDFGGFNQLQKLFIEECLIHNIDPDVFEDLGSLPGDDGMSGFGSRITNIEITNNEITHLNWGFLKPISASLQVHLNFSSVACITVTQVQSERYSELFHNFTIRRLVFYCVVSFKS